MRTLFLLLALTTAGWAAPPPKAVPLVVSGDTVTVVKSFPLLITASPGADIYFWSYPDALKCKTVDNVLTVQSAPPGTYTVSVTSLTITVDFDKKLISKTKDSGETTINVGGIKPPPPPPPPNPVGAMRVLIVFESADLPKLSKEQRQVLYDPKVRGALKDRTDKAGPDGTGWHIWDKDEDASQGAKFWQDALKRPRTATPFIHVFKGDAVAYEGPLPATVDETVALITKYAGTP